MRHHILVNAGYSLATVAQRGRPGQLLGMVVLLFAVLGTATAGWAQTSYDVLTTFSASDGYQPHGELTVGADGKLYGAATSGGAYNRGTIFRVDEFGLATTLYSFGATGDGQNPYGGLEIGPDGAFYGTTYYGGAHGRGTIFKITPSGTYTLLRSLGVPNFNCTGCYDGYHTYDGLELGTDGKLYGVTIYGGH